MKKKLLVHVLVCLLGTGFLFGCGDSKGTADMFSVTSITMPGFNSSIDTYSKFESPSFDEDESFSSFNDSSDYNDDNLFSSEVTDNEYGFSSHDSSDEANDLSSEEGSLIGQSSVESSDDGSRSVVIISGEEKESDDDDLGSSSKHKSSYERDHKDFSDYQWVLNTNSMKIHKPECMSVTNMKWEHAKGSDDTLEALMVEGYFPCQDCLKDASVIKSDEPDLDDPQEYFYVLNISSKKIHHPNCKSAAKIKDSNREESTLSLAELKAQGYTCCQNCFK